MFFPLPEPAEFRVLTSGYSFLKSQGGEPKQVVVAVR